MAAIVLTAVILAAFFECSSLSPPPLRDVVSDGPGGPDTCYRKNVATVPGSGGNVAIVRVSYCPGQDPVDIGYNFYIVFVHRVHETNSRDNIVLQFVPDDTSLPTTTGRPSPAALWLATLTQPPNVKWLGLHQLEVVIPGIVQTMVVQKDSIEGTKIRYVFDGGPPRSWNANLADPKDMH